MKTQHYLLLVLACLLQGAGLQAMQEASSSQQLPQVAVETPLVFPEGYLAHARQTPEGLKKKLDEVVSGRRELFALLLGRDTLALSKFDEERARNSAALLKAGITPQASHSNYVIALPEFPGYLLKIVRPGIRFVNAVKKADEEAAYNEIEFLHFKQNKTPAEEKMLLEKKQALFAKMNAYAASPSWRKDMYETYQAVSVLLALERIQKAADTYKLDNVVAVETHPHLFDEKALPHDRNCFLVQKFVKGTSLRDFVITSKSSSALQEKAKELVKQFYILVCAAHLWNGHDVIITEDFKVVPVDVEKRDRYVRPYIDANEAKHLMRCAFEEVGQILTENPELLNVWQDLMAKHPEVQAILRPCDHITKWFPRFKDMTA